MKSKANLPEIIRSAGEVIKDYGWNFLLEFATRFPEVAHACFMSPEIGDSVAVVKGAESAISVAIAKRHLTRCNEACRIFLTDLTQEKLDNLSDSVADLAVEMHEYFKQSKCEAYEEKLRYWAQLLHGQMDVETALKKDKYHRWKKWMIELDLISLKTVSMLKPSIQERDRYVNQHLYRQHWPDSQVYITTTLSYLQIWVNSSKTNLFTFVAQVSGAGLCFFEKAGGSGVPGKAAHVVWHNDLFDFTKMLRDAEKQKPIGPPDAE